MKYIFLVIMFVSANLYAITLDKIINKALEENPSLESISHIISANKSNIDVSDQFANPTITYVQNTLDDDQAMSQKSITLQQKLPYFGKRDAMKNVALAQEGILNQTLEQVRVSLVKNIKNRAFDIWELEQQYKIIQNYEDLTKQNIELFESYTSSSGNQHMGIMSAKLTLSDLRIKKSVLKLKIASSYSKLSYLASFDVTDLDLELVIEELDSDLDLQEGLVNNTQILLKEKELKKVNAMVESVKLTNYPDVNLLAGYAHRKNFDNYATFGIGLSLPIYGSEDYKEQEIRKLSLSVRSAKEDKKISINSEFKTAYLEMKSAYEIYHIVHGDALPQLEHMFDLVNSSVSTGGDLFKYIDILIKKLKLEQKSIESVANYNRAKATISALSGELK